MGLPAEVWAALKGTGERWRKRVVSVVTDTRDACPVCRRMPYRNGGLRIYCSKRCRRRRHNRRAA